MNSQELNIELATLMGWVFELDGSTVYAQNWRQARKKDFGIVTGPPDFANSIDELSKGPEELLRKSGCKLEVVVYDDGSATATWYRDGWEIADARDLDGEAQTRAQAALAALKALRSVQETEDRS